MTLEEWIIFGETGTSSKTMWAVLMDAVTLDSAVENKRKGSNLDVPYDKSDFNRCYKLWKECNVTKAQLHKIKTVLKWWSPFIDNWDELVRMLEADMKMYDYIQKLEEESKILDGWVRTSPTSWRRES